MSEEENKETPIKAIPTEETSIHVMFSDEHKETVYKALEEYDEANVIKGTKFFILTFEDTEKRDSGTEKIKEKLKDIIVKVADYKKSIRQIRAEETKRKVYLTGFSEEVTEEQIKELFKKFGEIEEVILLKSPSKNNSPYAFVKFKDEEPVQKAVEGEVKIDDTKLTVEPAVPKNSRFGGQRNNGRGQKNGSRSIMLANFGPKVSSAVIQKETAQFGEVSSFRVEKDHAIVTYKAFASAKNAVEKLNGKKLFDTNILCIMAPGTANGGRDGPRRGSRRPYRKRKPYRRSLKKDGENPAAENADGEPQ